MSELLLYYWQLLLPIIGRMSSLATTKANLVCWLVLKRHQFPRERMHSYLQLGVCCRAPRILQLLPPGRDPNGRKHLR